MSDILEEVERSRALRDVPLVQELITEVERLRSDLEHMEIDCSAWRRSSERKDARIKELEAVLADMSRRAERLLVTVTEDEAHRKRLVAALLKPETIDLLIQIVGAGATTSRAVRKIEQADMWDAVYDELQTAREALEKIRIGEKDD